MSIARFAIILLQSWLLGRGAHGIPYSEFAQHLTDTQLQEVDVRQGYLEGKLQNPLPDGGSPLVLNKPALCQIGSATRFFSAHRAGLNPVMVPKWNRRDLDELPEDVCQSMTFISVEMIDEVLHASLRTGTGTEGL